MIKHNFDLRVTSRGLHPKAQVTLRCPYPFPSVCMDEGRVRWRHSFLCFMGYYFFLTNGASHAEAPPLRIKLLLFCQLPCTVQDWDLQQLAFFRIFLLRLTFQCMLGKKHKCPRLFNQINFGQKIIKKDKYRQMVRVYL